jgi:CBS domain containing-hemolysin-like protein
MLLITYFFIAIGISFLCSILEAVILSITPAYIKVIKSKKKNSGKLLEKQKENIDQSIGAILTLNTFAHTFGAAGVGAEAVKIFGNEYMFYVSALLTILILIFSEIIPKTIGAYYWKPLSIFSSKIIQILIFITYPLLYLMNKITTCISKKQSVEQLITKEELEATVNMGEIAGILKEKDSLIIENILTLNEIKIKDIYTPRKVVFALEKQALQKSLTNQTLTELDTLKLKEYSRVPIYDGHIDNIIGIILSKELFYQYISTSNSDTSTLIKPVYKINENIPVSKLLDLFISKKEHMFIVVDKYNQTEGIVTLEDAIETLLGIEIVDELDQTIDLRELAKQKIKNL